jgi:hypothetical protein
VVRRVDPRLGDLASISILQVAAGSETSVHILTFGTPTQAIPTQALARPPPRGLASISILQMAVGSGISVHILIFRTPAVATLTQAPPVAQRPPPRLAGISILPMAVGSEIGVHILIFRTLAVDTTTTTTTEALGVIANRRMSQEVAGMGVSNDFTYNLFLPTFALQLRFFAKFRGNRRR